MPLPQAYRQDKVLEGMRSPDFNALQQALPPRVPEGEEPEIVDLRELAGRFWSVGEAMPKTGRQGVFGYVYATLTDTLADVVDGKPEVAHLPVIENPDVLIRQANFFAQEWLNPAHDLVAWGMAHKRGDHGTMRDLAWNMDQLWRTSFDDPRIQVATPPGQLIAGGLTNHIIKDLPPSLLKSGVTAAYMRPGGDYDNVSKHISHVSYNLSTEMMDGNKALVRIGALTVAKLVAVMRSSARGTYNELRQSGSKEESDEIIRRAAKTAIYLNEQTVTRGESVARIFGRVALGGRRPTPELTLPEAA